MARKHLGSINAIFMFLAGVIVVGIFFPFFLDITEQTTNTIVPLINDTRLQGIVVKTSNYMPYLPILLLVVLFIWVVAEAYRREHREYVEDYTAE